MKVDFAMPLMDEFKEEREEIKNKSFKEKCAYFWCYYKWHVIGTIAGIALAISLLHTFLTHKEIRYYAVFMNTVPTEESAAYESEFAKLTGLDLKKYRVYFDTDMIIDFNSMSQATISNTQKIMVYVSAGDMDVMLADIAGMNQYAYNGTLIDLREFLTEEECRKYEPYFYYMDRELALKIQEELPSDISYPENYNSPEGMSDPVPVGIRVSDCKELNEKYYFEEEHYFCIFATTKHPDLNRLFLDYIWQDN